MVKRETYLAFNLCGERFLDPPATPPGLNHWNGCPLTALIQSLPFDRSDLVTLNEESDVIQFASVFDYRTDSDLCAEFRAFIDEFCVPNRSSASSESDSDVRQDKNVITAAKYPFALRQMLRGLVGEDFAFCFELPYLIEAEDDLLVSFELAVQAQSKQSIQMLRSVLEVTIAHAYFGVRGEDYDHLVAISNFRMPSFSGPKGMVQSLVDSNVMPQTLAAECRSLYALMSKATHSHIGHLTAISADSGIPTAWAHLAARVGAVLIELVLRLLMKGI
jgi:hypothetical protein